MQFHANHGEILTSFLHSSIHILQRQAREISNLDMGCNTRAKIYCVVRVLKSLPMNIYFSCSITGGRADQAIYAAIVNRLLADGHDVPTAHLSSPDIMSIESVVSPAEVYHRDVAWVEGCNALIAEVSTPSHGVGYEIALALSLGKPVLCLYRQGKRVSKMITGNDHPAMRHAPYEDETAAVTIICDFLRNL